MTGTKTSPEGQERNNLIWIGKTQTDPYWERCATHFDIECYENVYDAVADILIHEPIQACVINGISFGLELKTLIQTILSRELARSIFVYNLINWPSRYDLPFSADSRVIKIKNVTELTELLERVSDAGLRAEQANQSLDVEKNNRPVDQTRQSLPPLSPAVESIEEQTPDISTVEKKTLATPWPMEPPVAERSCVAESASRPDTEIPRDLDSEISEENNEQAPSDEFEDALNLDNLSSKTERKNSTADTDDTEIGEGNFHLAQLTSEELDALLGFEPDKKMKERT